METLETTPLLVSMAEAAKMMGISRARLYELKKQDRRFPTIKIGARVLVSVDSLKAYIQVLQEEQNGSE